jgi:hypothetical protein
MVSQPTAGCAQERTCSQRGRCDQIQREHTAALSRAAAGVGPAILKLLSGKLGNFKVSKEAPFQRVRMLYGRILLKLPCVKRLWATEVRLGSAALMGDFGSQCSLVPLGSQAVSGVSGAHLIRRVARQ